MTKILYGDREDVLFQIQREGWKIQKRSEELKKTQQTVDQVYSWRSRSLVPEPFVFLTPEFMPKDVSPKHDRHLAFIDEIPPAWSKWATEHQLSVTHFSTPTKSLVSYLEKNGFSAEAAQYWVAMHPGGRYPVIKALRAAQVLINKDQIELDDLVEVWPHQAEAKYSVSIGKLLGALGKPQSMSLVKDVQTNEAFMLLRGLEKAFTNQEDRLWMLRMFIHGIMIKKWQPKAALIMLIHSLLKDSTWNSKSTKTLELSTLDPTIQTYLLLHAS